MANTLNTYFSSMFTHEQLNNIPQLPIYVGNTIHTFNFRLYDVQEKLNRLNMHKLRWYQQHQVSHKSVQN